MVPSESSDSVTRAADDPSGLRTVEKAYAYLTRPGPDGPSLLVFNERPISVGTEIPKGTVEPYETPREAVLRETREETGLYDVELVSKVESDHWRHHTKPKQYHRHFFHLRADPDRERWRHTVTGDDDDNGEVYECFWTDPSRVNLIRGMDAYLDAVIAADSE